MSLRDQKFTIRPINFFGAVLIGSTVLSGLYLHSIGSANEDYEFVINFGRGVAIDPRELPKIKEIADLAASNGNYEITIKGHTSVSGSNDANIALGEKRAQAVEELLINENVSNPIVAIGVGGNEPLKRLNNESDRNYQLRSGRATVKVESAL